MTLPDRTRLTLAVGVVAAALLSLSLAGPSGAQVKKGAKQQALETFRKLSPEARWELIEKLPDNLREFHTVKRGDVAFTIVERGALEPGESSDVFCRLKARQKGSAVASTIKWVIDDGTFVKKGEKLIELDDAALQDQRRAQRAALEQAEAARKKAATDLKLVRMENEVEQKLAAITLRLAELQLKQFKGEDHDRKEILQLKVEHARLTGERLKIQGKAREAQVEADLQARSAALELETARLREIEEQLKQCVLTAPRDGFAVYYVPARRPGAGQPILAQGEPVYEGQKLIQIADLKRMAVQVRVHEALVARVRNGQAATVRVDAFPNRVLKGQVKSVATVASAPEFFASDVKVYATLVAIDDIEAMNLKPNMSAEVTILAEHRAKVVNVPPQAVVALGKQAVCYVKVGKEIQERKVAVGLRGDQVVEIKEGLQEGDLVLRDLNALMGRLFMQGKKGGTSANGKEQAVRPGPPTILIRSVRPAEDKADRKQFVSSYGLTHEDLQRIAMLPSVVQAVPVRSFVGEVHHLERGTECRVIANTSGYADLNELELTVGRFLTDDDNDRLKTVVVLGSEAAADLFPFADPLGKSVKLGGNAHVVIGVLKEHSRAAGSLRAHELNRGVYLPLGTCQARFGEKIFIRGLGERRAEAVQLTEILLTVAEFKQVQSTVEAIRAMLARYHEKKDWEIRVLTP
jgi:hypothetical protein